MIMRRPRVKPEHLPYRVAGGRIRIGGVSAGLAGELDDPTGSVWTLLQCMNGSRSPAQIVASVRARHPDEPADQVSEAIADLIDSGYIEDAGAQDPAELTEREKERYSRSRMYFRWMDLTPRASTWEPQVALRRARVTVAGVGGTGGMAAMALAASGVGQLHCVDPDRVELSNLNRQVLFDEADIGVPKVTAAVARLARLNSDIEVTGEQTRIENADDLLPLAKGCDVLLLAADNPPAIRGWANRACLSAGTPWVEAGYHGPQVTVGTYIPGASACWECLRLAQDEQDVELNPNLADTVERADAVAMAVSAVSAGISGQLAAQAVLSLLTGVPPPTGGQIQAVNLVRLNAPFALASPRRPDCPGCGVRSGNAGARGAGAPGAGAPGAGARDVS